MLAFSTDKVLMGQCFGHLEVVLLINYLFGNVLVL